MAGEVSRSDFIYDRMAFCPFCGNGKSQGHEFTCPFDVRERLLAEVEAEKVRLEQALEIKKRQHKHLADSLFALSIERKELAAKMELVRKFIGSFTKYHEEMCSTFLDDAPEDECDCAKGAATKLLAQLDKTQDERDQLTADYESILVDHNKLLAEHVAMGAENMKLAANLKVTRGWSAKLVDFLSEGLEAAWDGCDWEGSDIQDKAEELGLIKSEPYDPKKHGEITCLPVERDTVTFYTICEEVLQLKEPGTPDTDHCPSCGEYLHDEMGHMCPPTRQPDCSETDEVAEYLRREEHDRAIRMDTAKLAVVIAKEEEILFGPEDYNKAVKDVVAALERDFGLEG